MDGQRDDRRGAIMQLMRRRIGLLTDAEVLKIERMLSGKRRRRQAQQPVNRRVVRQRRDPPAWSGRVSSPSSSDVDDEFFASLFGDDDAPAQKPALDEQLDAVEEEDRAAADDTSTDTSSSEDELDDDDDDASDLTNLVGAARIPLTSDVMGRIQEAGSKLIKFRKGQPRRPLEAIVNINLDRVARWILNPGSHVCLGVEQSDKSLVIGATIIMNHVTGANKPIVVLVKDLVASVREVREKMGPLLKRFKIAVQYANRNSEFSTFEDVQYMHFSRGGTALIVPCHAGGLEKLARLLERHRLTDVVLILDESDVAWSSRTEADQMVSAYDLFGKSAFYHELPVTKREQHIYRILGAKPLDPTFGSRVRSIIHVSATHWPTLAWHDMHRLPFTSAEMNQDALAGRGYAVYDDLTAFEMEPGTPVYLTNADITTATLNGVRTQKGKAFLKAFARDARPYRLMQVSVTQYVNCTTVNALNVAQYILKYVKDAVVLVKSGVGVTRIESSTPDLANLQIGRESVLRDPEGRPLTKLADAIRDVDTQRHGANVPVVVIGMQCVGRCTSVRSAKRVITHMIATPGKGRTSGDTQQLFARGFGQTKEVRKERGYDSICVLTRKADLEMVKRQYEFTQDALRRSGTGRLEDLDAWRASEYKKEYEAVVKALRPLGSGDMNIRSALEDVEYVEDADDEENEEDADDEEDAGVADTEEGDDEVDDRPDTSQWVIVLTHMYQHRDADNTVVLNALPEAVRRIRSKNHSAYAVLRKKGLIETMKRGTIRITSAGISCAKRHASSILADTP